ncbi:redoxin domain-containing protein [Yaniella halotolerans]|uniref:redoxin domain-containing protein n=1 Tax=Yaniella halotolerans TaxID=225453 RepID=UPI0003B74386|nr:redoxin domain-containing protein [Yaniella halotolerans]
MTAPALRDQFGQAWQFPPIEGIDQPGYDRTWLIFIPGAYTPICMSELEHVNELAGQLAVQQVGVRLIAPDAAPVLRMVTDQLDLQVPFLSDFWPHGAAADHFGILDKTTGRPQRVSLLISRSGEVLEHISATAAGRNMSDHLSVLQSKK